MGSIDLWYLLVLLGLFVIVNYGYKKFPRNDEKLLKMLTDQKL